MSTWNKVLVGLVLVTSVVYFYFGARALKTHQAWQQCYESHQAALEKAAKQKDELVNGAEGLRALKVEVHKFTVDRGRVWPGTKPQQFNPNTGDVSVIVNLPPPPQPNARNVQLFAFEEPTQGKPFGDYLGVFTLMAVGGQGNQQWQLQPARALTDDQKARIQQSRATWSLYERMPRAVPGYFELAERGRPAAEATPGKVEEAAPSAAAAAAEPSPRDTAKQAPGAQPKFEYLADYEGLFNEYYHLRAALTDAIASEQADLAAMENSLARAQQRIDQLHKEVAEVKVELAKVEAARDTVANHQQGVQKKVDELQSAIVQTQKANQDAAAEIARIQLEAARRIDERTRNMAQAGAGQ